MSKKTSAIVGVNFKFRPGKKFDAFRAWVFKDGRYVAVSAKVHPTLKRLNKFLSDNGLRGPQAEKFPEFIELRQRLEHELRSEFGLATYKAIAKLDMQTKNFDFEKSLDDFQVWKSDTSVSYSYRRTMEHFWLPFFLKVKHCIHPSEFIEHQEDAKLYVRAHKSTDGKPISFHSYNGFFKVLNQYMKFCLAKRLIGPGSTFGLWVVATKEEMKRGMLKRKRSTDTYDLNDLIEIKKRIDATYADAPEKKKKAYGFLMGIYTGLRQANILGLKAEDLFPENEIPHFRVSDSIVSGYSRGLKGSVTFINATKTTTQEDEEIVLPLLQPSVEIASEVATFLKANYEPKDRICPATPGTFYRAWERICDECDIKFLNPHNWKHSYATIGTDNLEAWYRGNPRLLQLCCLHTSYSMTERYIKKRFPKSLTAWAKK